MFQVQNYTIRLLLAGLANAFCVAPSGTAARRRVHQPNHSREDRQGRRQEGSAHAMTARVFALTMCVTLAIPFPSPLLHIPVYAVTNNIIIIIKLHITSII